MFSENKLISAIKNMSKETLQDAKDSVEWIGGKFESEEFKSNFSEDDMTRLNNLMDGYPDEVLTVYLVSELSKGE